MRSGLWRGLYVSIVVLLMAMPLGLAGDQADAPPQVLSPNETNLCILDLPGPSGVTYQNSLGWQFGNITLFRPIEAVPDTAGFPFNPVTLAPEGTVIEGDGSCPMAGDRLILDPISQFQDSGGVSPVSGDMVVGVFEASGQAGGGENGEQFGTSDGTNFTAAVWCVLDALLQCDPLTSGSMGYPQWDRLPNATVANLGPDSQITWLDLADTALMSVGVQYNIHRAPSPSGPWTQIATGITPGTETYTDPGQQGDYYAISATFGLWSDGPGSRSTTGLGPMGQDTSTDPCATDAFRFNSPLIDIPVDLGGGPEFEQLRVEYNVSVPISGIYRVWTDLAFGVGGPTVFEEIYLQAGDNRVNTSLFGYDAFLTGIPGPWTFSVQIEDPVTMDTILTSNPTFAYQPSDFTPIPPATVTPSNPVLEDLDVMGTLQGLYHEFTFDVQVPGFYFFDGRLLDANFSMIDVNQFPRYYETGLYFVRHHYGSDGIFFGSVNGPYLSDLQVYTPFFNFLGGDLVGSIPHSWTDFTGEPPPFVWAGKTASAQTISPGDSVDYTIVVENFGFPLPSLYVTDIIPPGFLYVGDNADLLANFVSRNVSSKTVTWEFRDVGATGLLFDLTLRAEGPFPLYTTHVRNHLTVDYDVVIASEPQSSVEEIIVQRPVADLTISADRAVMYAGEVVNHQIDLANLGCVPIQNITIAYNISNYGTPISFSIPPSFINGSWALWNFTDIPANSSQRIDIGFRAFSWLTDGTWITTRSTVEYDINGSAGQSQGGPIDLQPVVIEAPLIFDSSPTANTLVIAPNGTLTASNLATGPAPGQSVNYLITSENTGNGTAGWENMTTTLPSDLVYVGSSPAPSGQSGQSLWWNLTNVAPNTTTSIDLNTTLSGSAVVGNALDLCIDRAWTTPNATAWYNKTSCTNTTIGPGVNISVGPGWNLVSHYTDKIGTPDVVFDDGAGDDLTTWDRAWEYDAWDATWYSWDANRPTFMNDIFSATVDYGYWLNVTSVSDGYLSLTNTVAVSTNGLGLTAGWNLVGHPNSSPSTVSGLPGCVSMVQAQNMSTPSAFLTLSGADPLSNGVGYWYYATGICFI